MIPEEAVEQVWEKLSPPILPCVKVVPLEVVLLVAFTLTPLIDPEQKVVPDEVEEQVYQAWETEVIPINPTNEILVANNSLIGFIVKK